ncbi:MAG: inositol monophosphatase [Candidatus Omnitrophica bacterium]|nr:inositol monophosphatase [Candidatus Omnitrophota bacterium]
MRTVSGELQHVANVAREAAWEAGNYCKPYAGRAGALRMKSAPSDLVSKIDHATEALIASIVLRAFPDHAFLGEEQTQAASEAETRWIVDPIDGTTNFVHGLPWFAVSIAVERRGELVVGVIYDPMREEMFQAIRGGGSVLNGRRIRVSKVRRLAEALLNTGFPHTFRQHPKPLLRRFEAFQSITHAVRRMGSTAMSLASMAAGRIDGFWEEGTHPWDIAAGLLLVREAGGCATDWEGAPATIWNKRPLVSNGRLHGQMIQVLKRTG